MSTLPLEQIRLALVIHNHQPVGNKDEIIERIFRTSYFPFLKLLESYPEIQVNLHYTGFLLEWMELHHPEFLELLRKMVERDQVELVGGAYFEPVISVIPDADIRGQTSLLSEKIRSLFHNEPRGFWTAERAWEPNLPEILADIRASHTFVDDISFESAGLSEADCFEAYTVESRGKSVIVFPILKKLRYLIPFKPVSSTISFLKSVRGAEIAVYGDDGEKFGAWPNTFDQVYKNGWLKKFLREISRNSWIETVRISEYLKERSPKGRIYLPASAYSEMMEWAIPVFPPPKSKRIAKRKGKSIPHRGFWRLFLAKYPESARLYSKMLEISQNLYSLNDKDTKSPLLDLWKGQCNDAYWHGVFGGLYAPLLRKITYENLIRAQVGYEKLVHTGEENWLSVSQARNGSSREIQLDSRFLRAVVSPERGGAICELDFKPGFVNLLDTLTRRPERYHAEIKKKVDRTIVPGSKKNLAASIHEASGSKEKGLQKLLIYDRYPKFSYVDHLVETDNKMDSFVLQNFREIAPLPALEYEVEIQKSNEVASLILTTRSADVRGDQIKVEKKISISAKSPSLRVEYAVQMSGEHVDAALFTPEINFGGLSDPSFAKDFGTKSRIVESSKLEIAYKEPKLRASLSCQNSNSIWILPVKTVSLSEEGFESNLQGISILPIYYIGSKSGEAVLKASIDLQVNST